jgi:hypothetical protein
MLDPISALGVATAAFKTIKKGFEFGRDVESMYKDIGRWMTANEAITQGHARAKGKGVGSIEEEALETFGALKKAKRMEDELRNWLIATHGMNAWNDLLRIQASIRKKRKEEAEKKRRELEQMIKWGFGGFIFLCVAVLLIIVGLKYYGY